MVNERIPDIDPNRFNNILGTPIHLKLHLRP